jgi:hypothetical protein
MTGNRAGQLVEAGVWLQMSGDKEGARRLFEEALRIDPSHGRARELLGQVGPSDPQAPPRTLTPDAFQLPPLPDGRAPTGWESRSGPGEQIAVRHEPRDAMGILADPLPAPMQGGNEELQALLAGVDDLLALDDHSGALELLQKAEEMAPNHPDVLRRRDASEGVLETMLQSRLGSLAARPRVLMAEDEVIWLNLDHRAGFVLAQIDGTVTFDDLFALSGMSRLDTARILVQLLEEGVIAAA